MFPAARIGDPITHDQVVPSGVIVPQPGSPPNVLIEGLPAAKMGDKCACTGVLSFGLAHPPPPPPHPVSFPPIAKGSATVLINNMPAARWFPAPDMGACTVLLGDPKLAATRKTLIGG